MDMSNIGSLLFSFALPKIKNTKLIRDFKDKWIRDNYSQKVKSMFEAGIADAKASLNMPDELINDLLNDRQNREEIFLWIIEGKKIDNFDKYSLILEPYYERYPLHQDKIIPFFQLILVNINDYKEKEWDPEFLEILSKLEIFQENIQKELKHISSQNNRLMQKQDEMTALISNTLLSVDYEDLKALNSNDKVITAREKATERLKYAKSQEEVLQLHLVIANSYMASGFLKESIPHLYTAIAQCRDDTIKNRLLSIIKMNEGNYEEALALIKKNHLTKGYNTKDIEILLTIKYNQEQYDECLSILEEHGNSVGVIKVQIYIALNNYEEALNIIEQELKITRETNDWLLFKADALVRKMEKEFQAGEIVNVKEVGSIVLPILQKIESETENERQLVQLKELEAAIYFRGGEFALAAEQYKYLVEYKKEKDEYNHNYFMNLVFCYYANKDWEKAILLLQNILLQQKRIEFITFLIRIYLEKGTPQKALTTLIKYESYYLSTDNENIKIEFYIHKLETLFVLSKYKELKQLVVRLEEDTTNSSLLINIVKGYYYSFLHDWDNAITYLGPLNEKLKGKISLEIKLQLLNAYYQRANSSDLYSIIRIVPTMPHWKTHEQMINYYAVAQYEVGNYDAILDLYYNSLPEPPGIKLKEIVATIYYNNYWYELSKDIYEKLYHETQDINFLIRIANCDFNLGNKSKCMESLEFAKNKVLKKPTISDLQLLSSAYIEAKEYDLALNYAHKAFKLGERNPSLWQYFTSVFLHIEKFVKSFEDEWLVDYRKTLNEFGKYFPHEEPYLKKIKLMDNDKLSSDFLGMLKKDEENQEVIMETFKKYHLPGSFLAEYFGRGQYLTWSFIANEELLYFWSHKQGSIEEELKGIKKVGNTNNILLDPFSLFTLNELNLLEELSNRFHIYFDQKSYLGLCEEYTDLLLTGSQGIKTISYQDGRIYSNEATPNEVQKHIDELESLILWIDQNCQKVGNAHFKENKSLKQKFIDYIENPILVSKQGLASLMIDNFLIDMYAVNYDVVTMTVVDFVRYLFSKGKISKEQYISHISKLVKMGYSLIRITPGMCIYLLEKHNYQVNEEVSHLFNALKRVELNPEYVTSVIKGILVRLGNIPHKEIDHIANELSDIILYHEGKIKGGIYQFIADCEKNVSAIVLSKIKEILL